MRSKGILTMGTAFPRVPPRNDHCRKTHRQCPDTSVVFLCRRSVLLPKCPYTDGMTWMYRTARTVNVMLAGQRARTVTRCQVSVIVVHTSQDASAHSRSIRSTYRVLTRCLSSRHLRRVAHKWTCLAVTSLLAQSTSWYVVTAMSSVSTIFLSLCRSPTSPGTYCNWEAE